jgi:predicted transcriptional regulator of viral defense system
MTKMDSLDLRKIIGREEFDYVMLTSALSEYSGIRTKINDLLSSGVIVRVKKGLYVFGPRYNQQPICKEILANLIYGPSCISLEYALSYHGLTPERVETVTSITPKRDKHFETPVGTFTYKYLKPDKYPWGITQEWIDQTHPVLMASPEKALCDYIALHDVNLAETAPAKFLENDLRIDPSNWTRFNAIELVKLNRHYRIKGLDSLVEVL